MNANGTNTASQEKARAAVLEKIEHLNCKLVFPPVLVEKGFGPQLIEDIKLSRQETLALFFNF